MRRVILKLATLLGLVLVLVAALGFALLGAQGTWATRTTIPAGMAGVVIDSGLASISGPKIKISVKTPEKSAAGRQLFIGRARPADLTALVGKAQYLGVTGLSGARKLTTKKTTGSPTLPAPAVADIWSSRATGVGSVSLTGAPGTQESAVLIAAPDGAALPELDLVLSWANPRWLWIPSLLLLFGTAILVLTSSFLRNLVNRAGLAAAGAELIGQARQLGAKSSEKPAGRRARPSPSPAADAQEHPTGATRGSGERSQRRSAARKARVPEPTAAAAIPPAAASPALDPAVPAAATRPPGDPRVLAPEPAGDSLPDADDPLGLSDFPLPPAPAQQQFFATAELPIAPKFMAPPPPTPPIAPLQTEPGLFPTGLFPAVEFRAPASAPERTEDLPDPQLTRRELAQRRTLRKKRR